jgi:hypothetical protein
MFIKKDKDASYYLLLFIFIAAPIVLLSIVCFSPHRLIYDENNFYFNVRLIRRFGLSDDFLLKLRNQSPGPLYQLIYYPFLYFNIKSIVAYRVMNYVYLGGIVLFLYKLMDIPREDKPVIRALLIFSIPLTWTTGGLSLTEIPTIFFALLSVITIRSAIKSERNQLALLVLGGLLSGLTILGRSPFLMMVPAVVYWLYRVTGPNKVGILAYLFLSLSMPAYVFYTWKGLVPPNVQQIQSGLNPLFLAYTFAYTCFFLLIIYPDWYKLPMKYYKMLGALLLLLFVLNISIFNFEYIAMKSFMALLPTSISFIGRIFSTLLPCIMCCLAILHLVTLKMQLDKSKGNEWRIFLLLAATFIALTTIKSAAQFSTRYPYQSLPFLLIFCAPYIKLNKGLALRATVGIVLGIISLLGYYQLHYK